jgi:hypothetical protein
MLRYALVIGAVLISTLALSDGKDASYYCTAQFGPGMRFDAQSQKWKPEAFKDDDAFVLHLHYLGDKTEQRNLEDIGVSPGTVTVHYERYSATVTLRGSNNKEQCFDADDRHALPGEINIFSFDGKRSNVSCDAISGGGWFKEGLYRFNFVNNHFTHVSNIAVGFLEGVTKELPKIDSGPYVLAGTCTLIQ